MSIEENLEQGLYTDEIILDTIGRKFKDKITSREFKVESYHGSGVFICKRTNSVKQHREKIQFSDMEFIDESPRLINQFNMYCFHGGKMKYGRWKERYLPIDKLEVGEQCEVLSHGTKLLGVIKFVGDTLAIIHGNDGNGVTEHAVAFESSAFVKFDERRHQSVSFLAKFIHEHRTDSIALRQEQLNEILYNAYDRGLIK